MEKKETKPNCYSTRGQEWVPCARLEDGGWWMGTDGTEGLANSWPGSGLGPTRWDGRGGGV
jgi:hypothetical protein